MPRSAWIPAGALIWLGLGAALAQPAVPTPSLPPPPSTGLVPAPVVSLPRIPPVEPSMALEGAALVSALRKGGLVLYLRHAETGVVTETCDQSNLTEAGRAMAKRIGVDMRRLEIPIDKVLSSEVCRVWETAKLMDVGPVEAHDDLHRIAKRPDHRIHAGRWKLIGTPPPPGKNRLLAGHIQGGEADADRVFLDMGEIIVFRPDGKGAAQVIARVRANEWQALIDWRAAAPGK